MRCDAMRCDAMRCDAMRCDAMRCDAMRCDAMRCDAMRCDAMRCDAIQRQLRHIFRRLDYKTDMSNRKEFVRKFKIGVKQIFDKDRTLLTIHCISKSNASFVDASMNVMALHTSVLCVHLLRTGRIRSCTEQRCCWPAEMVP